MDARRAGRLVGGLVLVEQRDRRSRPERGEQRRARAAREARPAVGERAPRRGARVVRHARAEARDASGGAIEAVSDDQILEAYAAVARCDGIFCEPASAASVIWA